jgi:putative transposase
MARPLRIEYEGALYHLTGRGNERQRIFTGEHDRARFLELVEESLERYAVQLHAFVLMGNHYHLLAQTRRANLGRWMHWLVTSYTIFYNRRHRRVGHLFQGRYKSIVVEADSYLLELSRYIHLNPVRGKREGELKERRARLREWRWSSYRGYAGLTRQHHFVSEELVLGALTRSRVGGRRVRYRRFVEEGLLQPVSNPLEGTKWGAVLGSESFQQRVLDRLTGWKERRREIQAVRAASRGAGLDRIVSEVGRAYGLTKSEVLGQHGRIQEAKGVALTVAWDLSGLSLRELGEYCGGLDYAAVAQQIHRTRKRADRGELKIDLHSLKEKCQRI